MARSIMGRVVLKRRKSIDVLMVTELLEETQMEINREERKRNRDFRTINRLRKREGKMEKFLYQNLKAVILRRDGYKCRACGSAKNLSLAHLFPKTDYSRRLRGRRVTPYTSPKNRWAEKNLLTLCRNCHRSFDSLQGRRLIKCLKISSVGGALRLLAVKSKWWRIEPLLRRFDLARGERKALLKRRLIAEFSELASLLAKTAEKSGI
jgi:5-methylcytosine-specific restriction endonuclease McrA